MAMGEDNSPSFRVSLKLFMNEGHSLGIVSTAMRYAVNRVSFEEYKTIKKITKVVKLVT